MPRFIAECPMCAWESSAADVPEVAVDLGVTHLEQVHGPAIVAATHPAVRVWQFQQLSDAEITRQAGGRKEPEAPKHAAVEQAEPQAHQESKRPTKGREGR